jgi:hypothetical protein
MVRRLEFSAPDSLQKLPKKGGVSQRSAPPAGPARSALSTSPVPTKYIGVFRSSARNETRLCANALQAAPASAAAPRRARRSPAAAARPRGPGRGSEAVMVAPLQHTEEGFGRTKIKHWWVLVPAGRRKHRFGKTGSAKRVRQNGFGKTGSAKRVRQNGFGTGGCRPPLNLVIPCRTAEAARVAAPGVRSHWSLQKERHRLY